MPRTVFWKAAAMAMALAAVSNSTTQAQDSSMRSQSSPGNSVEHTPPRRGVAGLVVGSLGLAASALFFGAISSCSETATPEACKRGGAVIATATLATGVVGMTLGLRRHRAYKRWVRRQRNTADVRIGVASETHGWRLILAGRF